MKRELTPKIMKPKTEYGGWISESSAQHIGESLAEKNKLVEKCSAQNRIIKSLRQDIESLRAELASLQRGKQ